MDQKDKSLDTGHEHEDSDYEGSSKETSESALKTPKKKSKERFPFLTGGSFIRYGHRGR